MAIPIWTDTYTGKRYTYGAYLRPWNLASLPPEIRDSVILGAGSTVSGRHPFGTMTFARQIPVGTCRQLSIEEVSP